MSDRGPVLVSLLLVASLGVIGAVAAAGRPPAASSTGSGPATAASTTSAGTPERPVIGAPPDSGPPKWEAVLDDPSGSIDLLTAAGGHVAWAVRRPAETTSLELDRLPATWPVSSTVVVHDESGATSFAIDYGKRWISGLRFVGGPQALVDPKLAVRSCASRDEASCKVELLSITSGVDAGVAARETGRRAQAAIEGRLSGDQEIVAGRRAPGTCTPLISVYDAATQRTRRLPLLPRRDADYATCVGLNELSLDGPYAFARVARKDSADDLEAEYLYGLDLRTDSPRWARVRVTSSTSAAGGSLALGPAVGLNAMYFATLDLSVAEPTSFEAVALAAGVRTPAATTNVSVPPFAGADDGVCQIAATHAAVYVLDNSHCAAVESDDEGSARIMRLTNPPLNAGMDTGG